MFKWLFGKLEKIRIKEGFTATDSNGNVVKYVYDKYDCVVCGAPGFTCKDFDTCPHFH